MRTARTAARDYQEVRAGGHVIHCRTLILLPAPLAAGEEKIPTTPGGAARPRAGAVMQIT